MSGGGRKGGGGVRQRVVAPLHPPPRYNAFSPSLPRSLAPSFLPPLPSPALPWQKWVCASWGCAISQPLHWLTWSGGMRGGREGGRGPAGWLAGRPGRRYNVRLGVGALFPENAARSPARVCDKIGIGASGLGASASPSLFSAVRSSHRGEPNGRQTTGVFSLLTDVQKSWLTGQCAVWCTGLCFSCSKKKKKKKTAQEFRCCFNRTLQKFFFFFFYSQRGCKNLQ